MLTWPVGLVLLGALVIAGTLLLTDSRAQIPSALVWLPLILCPLMHLFMHRGHGHQDRGGHRHSGQDRDNP